VDRRSRGKRDRPPAVPLHRRANVGFLLDQLEFFVKSPLLLLKQVLPGMKRAASAGSLTLAVKSSSSEIPALRITSRQRALSWDSLGLGRVSSHQAASLSTSWRRAGFQPSDTQMRPGRSRELRRERSHEPNGYSRGRCQSGCFPRKRRGRLHYRQRFSVNGGNTLA
jgi:hypothetical protein